MVMYLFWYLVIGLFISSLNAGIAKVQHPWAELSFTGWLVGVVLWPVVVMSWFVRLFQ